MRSTLVALFLATTALPQDENERLARAEQLLAESKEEKCRDGTELCVDENSVAAVELLLDLLRLDEDRGGFLPSAHYRDVVWDGLRRMTSREARARVEQELVKNKKQALVRQWCAELLGEYRDPAFAASLVEACRDKDLGVHRAAARALGKLRFPEEVSSRSAEKSQAGTPDVRSYVEARKTLLDSCDDKDAVLRTNARDSLARLDPEGSRGMVVGGLADKDAGVRCALLGVVGELYPEIAEEHAAKALADPDWRPRMQAVDVLSEIETPSAMRHLIDALGDARPAVVARATRHLQERSGEKHTRKEAWEAWWKAKGEEFDFSKGRQKDARTPDSTVSASFNGIVFESDHTAFLIDVSADMANELVSQSCSKAEAAQKELEATLARLQGRMQFSLFTYAGRITPFSKKGPTELNAKSQEKALAFVRDQRLDGAKDIWQTLEAVLADPAIDTVFLLSSGEPEIGLYVHWNRVTWHLADLNRFRKLVVHAIAYSDNQWYRDQLEKIAAVTGGEFRYFE